MTTRTSRQWAELLQVLLDLVIVGDEVAIKQTAHALAVDSDAEGVANLSLILRAVGGAEPLSKPLTEAILHAVIAANMMASFTHEANERNQLLVEMVKGLAPDAGKTLEYACPECKATQVVQPGNTTPFVHQDGCSGPLAQPVREVTIQ